MVVSDKIRIQKGIPVPARGKVLPGLMEVLRRMEVGDCIDLPGSSQISNVASYGQRARIRLTRRKITLESGETVYRFWRTQ